MLNRVFEANSSVVAEVRPSPNHDERAGDRSPDMIVLHYTGMLDATAALDRLCDPLSRVSAHYLVFEDGRIPVNHSGPAKPTSTPARSELRSSIPATITTIPIFRSARSLP
jgi:N-acetylmuramoyl-L-alanine amidase